MEVLVFKTDVNTKKQVKQFAWLLNQHPYIQDWHVDLKDVDKVLRVETIKQLTESDVIDIMQTFGCQCEALND